MAVTTGDPLLRERLVSGAAGLGIDGADRDRLVEVFQQAGCAATQALMAQFVAVRVASAQELSMQVVEGAAAIQAELGGQPPSMPPHLAELFDLSVSTAARLARLQAAAVRLAEPSAEGGCHEDCACVTAPGGATAARVPASRAALTAEALDGGPGSELVCTIDGGVDAMRGRIAEWQAMIGRAVDREPADGGVTLVYDHDPQLAVELARLGAAEFACCSFFTFSVTVGPAGIRFTVTAPEEAQDIVMSLFGTATPQSTRSS